MRYYLRFGKAFRLSLLLLLYPGAYIAIYYSRHKPEKMDYLLIVLYSYLLVSIILPRIFKFIYFIIRKRPVLTANETFIFDHYRNIKYDWDDIKEIIATDNYLEIDLYQPEKYYLKIINPFFKVKIKLLSYLFKRKSFFKIDILDIKKGENKNFLDSLNEFSMGAGD
jgi:hypothetical protein